jgi:hypothetical protein
MWELTNTIIDNTAFNVTLSLGNVPTDHHLFNSYIQKRRPEIDDDK